MAITARLSIALLTGMLLGCGSDTRTPSETVLPEPSPAPPQVSPSPEPAPSPMPRAPNITPATTPPAEAQINTTSDMVTLTTADGGVVVHRHPLSLDFFDAEGRTVLSSVSQDSSLPLLLRLPLPSRLLGGEDILAQAPALYAPFTFVTGISADLQFPATFWVGNMLTSASLGLEYRLTDVKAVSVQGNEVVLRVATSDPVGRGASVNIAPDENGSFKVSVRIDRFANEVPLVAAGFTSAANEAFRGFGGRRNKIDQRHESFLNWAEEFSLMPEQFETVLGETFGESNQFPTGAQGAYYIQSLFISNQGYGFLLDRDELSHWRLASDRDDAWRVEVAGGQMDFLVVPADMRSAVSKLSGINGRHRLPPRWSLGPMMSETIQEFTDTPDSYTAKVQESLDKIEELDLPLTAFAFEGWVGTKETGEFDRIIQRLRGQDIKPVTYYRAFVGQADDELEEHEVFEQAVSQNYITKNVLGLPYIFGSPLMGGWLP